MKKNVLSFMAVICMVFSLNAKNNNEVISEDCDELGALVFVGSLQRGMSAIDAYDLAYSVRVWCEQDFE